MAAGTSQRALVVGADCNSRVINPGDQKSFPLFGDGAGAVLLAPGSPDQGMLAYQLGSDGSGGDLLNRPACGSRMPPSPEALREGLHYLTMDGRAVFKWAVRMLADSCTTVLNKAGRTIDDVRWFIPHQANVRIIHAASDVLGFHRDVVYKNLERYGNTSGGSIPIALDELLEEKQVRRGRPHPDLGLWRGPELGDRPCGVGDNGAVSFQRPQPRIEEGPSRGRSADRSRPAYFFFADRRPPWPSGAWPGPWAGGSRCWYREKIPEPWFPSGVVPVVVW